MLLDEIIALLSDQKGSLEGALLNTKVLLHHIGHKELVPWVNNELAGYPDDAELPPYRISGASVMHQFPSHFCSGKAKQVEEAATSPCAN